MPRRTTGLIDWVNFYRRIFCASLVRYANPIHTADGRIQYCHQHVRWLLVVRACNLARASRTGRPPLTYSYIRPVGTYVSTCGVVELSSSIRPANTRPPCSPVPFCCFQAQPERVDRLRVLDRLRWPHRLVGG